MPPCAPFIVQVAAAFGVLYACTPFFLSYMHSPSAFKTMLVTFPSYFCFAPTVLADFFSYSVARTDDLSWGTKSVPGTSRSGVGGPGGNQRREAALARLAAARKRVAATAGAGAAGAKAHRASVRALRDGMRRNALAKESSQRTTNTLAVVQTVGSLAIALVNFLLNGILHHYLLTVGAVTAGVSVIVMLASFSYFVPRALYSRTAGSPGERLWSLLNFAGWLVAAGAVGLMWVSDDYTSWLWQDAAAAFATAISGLILVAAARFGACCSCSCGSSSHRAWSRLKEEEEAKGRLGSQGRKGRVAKGKGSTPATDEGSSDTSDSDTGSSAESDIDDDEDEEDGSDGEDGSMAEGPRGGRGKGSYVPPRGTQR